MQSPKGDAKYLLERATLAGQQSTDEELYKTALQICNPDRNLTKEEIIDCLTALGLLNDPEHTEMNWMGRRIPDGQ